MDARLQSEQQLVCERVDAEPSFLGSDAVLGASLNVEGGEWPLHGLRERPVGDTCGWYIWAGPWSEADDFFRPFHATHLIEWRPELARYLALPPGWRFLIAPGHEDVWFDATLLEEQES